MYSDAKAKKEAEKAEKARAAGGTVRKKAVGSEFFNNLAGLLGDGFMKFGATLPPCDWKGKKIVTSGIICDNPKLLQIFDDNKIAIAADDVAHESRMIRVDAAESGDPMMALAQQFADQDYDILLYDEFSNQNRRADFVVKQIKDSGAQGLVLFMQQFCDPEEMEYPYLKKALDAPASPTSSWAWTSRCGTSARPAPPSRPLPMCCKA